LEVVTTSGLFAELIGLVKKLANKLLFMSVVFVNNKGSQIRCFFIVDSQIEFFKTIGRILFKPSIEFSFSGVVAVVKILTDVNDSIFFTGKECT
jgi:hypothetical protein